MPVDPFFKWSTILIALMIPHCCVDLDVQTLSSYSRVHLCTSRLPGGPVIRSVMQEEDTHIPAATWDIMGLYSSPFPPGVAQPYSAQKYAHYQPPSGLCSPVPIWQGDWLRSPRARCTKQWCPLYVWSSIPNKFFNKHPLHSTRS